MAPRTLSRSWNHWRHVLSRASKNVSFCSLEMMEMHNREIGSEYLSAKKEIESENHVRSSELKFASLIKLNIQNASPPSFHSSIHAMRC